jgi:putative PIN family toxin of toxin-antitoxin system
MIVTVDTSVVFQGLYSSLGASHKILRLIGEGEIQLALSVPVFMEYCDVLKRQTTLEKTGLSAGQINAVLDFIAYTGLEHRISFLYRPNLVDESDNKFVELALSSQSKYLITANKKHFTAHTELHLFGVEVLTPAEFIASWRLKK